MVMIAAQNPEILKPRAGSAKYTKNSWISSGVLRASSTYSATSRDRYGVRNTSSAALISATSKEVAMAIKPTCSVTPTAFRNAGKVLRIKLKSKVISSP